MTATKYEVKRIGVFSLVKTLFLVGGISGFVIGIIEWILIGLIFWATQNAPIDPGLFDQSGMGDLLGAGIGFLGFLLPIFGGIAGAVGGVLFGFVLALTYNLSARLWGGIELDLAASTGVASTAPAPIAPLSGTVTRLPDAARRVPDHREGNEPPDPGPASDRSSSAMYE
ncbi:MAG: hypothetical protein AB1792_08965 [Candidatus Zixiibacteriota bacterium]